VPLALDGVTKRYGHVVALDDCSLAVDATGFHCLLGPNGSGKTTLLRLLLGLERPSAGSVVRDGVTVGSGFQRPNFYPGLTVRENLSVFGRFHDDGVDADWREHLLDGLRLRPALDRRAGDLSGGFARKLDLALGLQHRPDVVLLDEPLGALDDVSRARLLEFLADYAAEGHAVVVSTHRITSFEPSLDRLTVLRDGRVVVDRAREDLDIGDESSLQSRYVDLILEGRHDREGG
jgi:ABC-2 type transport system ATP-binding protein